MPTYPGISSDAFRHPLDYQAEQALRSFPGFDLLARKFVEFIHERPRHVYLMGNAIEVGPRQYASIYAILQEYVRDLDVAPEPVLFISQSPMVNAYALGQERPCIVMNTGLLDLMSESEMRSVIAHELGHIKCGHTTLNQMASWVITLMFNLTSMTFGLSKLISTGLILAFYEWLRKAELSADRASLLIMDDLNPILKSMMQLSGGSSRYANELNLGEFIRQSEHYQELDQNGLNQVYKFFLYNNLNRGIFLSHPFTVERVHYLGEWINSEEYQQIRTGNYQRTNYQRTGQESVNVHSQASDADEVKQLQREVDELQRDIDKLINDSN